jgi:hypothetical protein
MTGTRSRWARLAAYRCRVPVDLLLRSAATAGWLTAVLQGAVGVERALDVLGGDDEPLFVVPDDDAPLTLPFAVARWRRAGVAGWRYLPVAPGDAAGLPGPSPFAVAALDAGVALLAVGGPPVGLAPESTDEPTTWVEHTTSSSGPVLTDSAADAERALLEALNRSVTTLEQHQLASWGDQGLDLRAGWSASDPMPPGTDPRSERLATRSRRVLELLEQASADDGGSRTAADMALRRAALADLARAARHAHAVAWNTGLRGDAERR